MLFTGAYFDVKTCIVAYLYKSFLFAKYFENKEDTMFLTVKVQLLPNNFQKTRFQQIAGVSRFAYNWALSTQISNREQCGKFLSDLELRRRFTKLKKQKEYEWLNKYSNNVTKQAIKDCCEAYRRFFNGISNFPRFKSRKKSKPSFYVPTDRIKFDTQYVKLEKIATRLSKNKKKQNWVKISERNKIPLNSKYYNAHVSFDGLKWWLTVSLEVEERTDNNRTEGIGIDLGIKNLAICSNGEIYKSINKSKRIKNLEKKKRRLQRKISRKYLKNKKGESYCKTSNITKSEEQLLKLSRKLSNIRQDYIHKVTSNIISRKPMFISIEDLNVMWIIRNKKLSRVAQAQCLRRFIDCIKYKSKLNGIELRIVNRFFPSSKKCCICGNIKKDLRLSDRNYECQLCGNKIDRDFQASINIRDTLEYKIY